MPSRSGLASKTAGAEQIAALLLLYCCLQLLYCRPLTADERAVMAANVQVLSLLTLLVQKYKYWR